MKQRAAVGIVLVLFGVFLLMNRGQTFDAGTVFTYFWPSIFVIPVGLLFHWLYFIVLSRRGSGLLIPGGIILTVGVVCQIAMLNDSWGYMWPGFILAVAVGLFEFYWFGYRNRYLLIPIVILAGLSTLFFTVFSIGPFMSFLFGRPIVAAAMIGIGVIMLLGGFKSKKE